MARYEFERIFHNLIVEKGQNEQDNTEIKSRILSQLDAIDASGEVTAPRAPFKWAAVALAAAAAIVICIISSIWISDFYRYQTEIVPFINAYYAHANGTVNTDYATDPLEYLNRLTGIKINREQLPVQNIRSVSVDTIKGIEFGCIEMADPQRPNMVVSIFVTRADNYILPDRPTGNFNGRNMMVHTCQRCSMIGEKRNDYIFLVVGQPCCKPKELAQLASAL